MRAINCLLVLLLSVFTAAWPWPGSFEKIDGLLLGRQTESTSESSSAAGSTIASKATATNADSAASSNTAASDSSAAASTTSALKSGQSKSNTTTHHGTKTTSIDPRLPPGGIEMVTPAPIAGEQYFKVGDYVTFAWNYTSLSVTPTAVDILASCATNNAMYTIATNQTIDGPTGAVTWDTGEYQATATIPLLVATYTLVIHDSNKDVTAIPSAGYLAAYNQYYFGMYTPQPYVPLRDFKCASCNGALSMYEKQALSVLLLTSTITVLSFTWFVGGFGTFL